MKVFVDYRKTSKSKAILHFISVQASCITNLNIFDMQRKMI